MRNKRKQIIVKTYSGKTFKFKANNTVEQDGKMILLKDSEPVGSFKFEEIKSIIVRY